MIGDLLAMAYVTLLVVWCISTIVDAIRNDSK